MELLSVKALTESQTILVRTLEFSSLSLAKSLFAQAWAGLHRAEYYLWSQLQIPSKPEVY